MSLGTCFDLVRIADVAGPPVRVMANVLPPRAQRANAAVRLAGDRAALNLALLYQGPRPIGRPAPSAAPEPTS